MRCIVYACEVTMDKDIKVRVYHWNTNGTNDIEIVEISKSKGTSKVLMTLPEALFGVNISSDWVLMPVKVAIKHIAVSPMEDGTTVENELKKYL